MDINQIRKTTLEMSINTLTSNVNNSFTPLEVIELADIYFKFILTGEKPTPSSHPEG